VRSAENVLSHVSASLQLSFGWYCDDAVCVYEQNLNSIGLGSSAVVSCDANSVDTKSGQSPSIHQVSL